MISIKKYLDTRQDKANAGMPDKFAATIEAYRSGLIAMSKATAFDDSTHGVEAGGRLKDITQRVSLESSIDDIKHAASEVDVNLALWSRRAASQRQALESEVRELLLALADAASALDSRSKDHTAKFGCVIGNIEKIGGLEDIAQIRIAIIERVAELRSSIESLNQTNQHLVSDLQTKVSTFEDRLKSVEELAFTDSLTGLANRRCLEDRINYNIERKLPFCFVIFDLNRFKAVNDTFGHVAGDDLLRQVALKLKQNSRASDLVGRWGGDEFVLLLSGNQTSVNPHVRRLKQEVCARYMLHGSSGFYSTFDVETAVGVAQWRQDEPVTALIARADENMYRDKSHAARTTSPDQAPSPTRKPAVPTV